MSRIDQITNSEQSAINNSVDPSKVTNILYRQISLGLSILGIFFGAFIYLTSPTKDNDTAIQLQAQQIASQQETIDTITKTQQNDTQEVRDNLKDLEAKIGIMDKNITALTVTIDERIPKKK